ncbi:MAG: hypothetical protein ACFFEK_17505 [Candidatus Thorarchaeota archaeon]
MAIRISCFNTCKELYADDFGDYLALWLSDVDGITILFCNYEKLCLERTVMKILDKLLEVFGKRRSLLLGAATQPNDLKAYIYAVRASAYYRITGKKLPIRSLPSGEDVGDMTKNLSPSRRLARRDL